MAKKARKKKSVRKTRKKISKSVKKRKKIFLEKRKFAPIKASFLLVSMLGFVFSVLIVKKWDITWAFTFATLFAVMFVAAMLTMHRSTPNKQLAPRVK